MRMIVAVACAALAVATPALAQTANTTVAMAEPSQDQLAAAARLMDVMMPPAQREAMTASIVDAMMANVSAGIMNNGPLKTTLERTPEARPIFERFIARQRDLAQMSMRENLPSMIEAMATAYARRFTVVQLAELEAFFLTQTGAAYVEQSTTIMSDPAIAAWQQRVIGRDMERMPAEVARLAAEMRELAEKDDGNGQ